MDKTLVMKILEQKKIKYTPHFYDPEIPAHDVAEVLKEDPKQVFKTLVTKGKTNYYVFMIPINKELDLKLCAKLVGEKSVDMIKQKELEPLTGYVHGGCSPIGMKKSFRTFIDSSMKEQQLIYFSGGKLGVQIEINPQDLIKLVNARTEKLTKE